MALIESRECQCENDENDPSHRTVAEISKYDVVLTSYSVVESDYRHEKKGFKRQGEYVKKDSLLHGITWFRYILWIVK